MNFFNRVGIFGIGTVFGIVLCIAILIFTERHTVPQISVNVVNNSDYEIKEIKEITAVPQIITPPIRVGRYSDLEDLVLA